MSRAKWIALTVAAAPILAGSVIVSASLGPFGAIAYAALLLAGLNTHHLFHDHHPGDEDPLHRLLHRKGRHR